MRALLQATVIPGCDLGTRLTACGDLRQHRLGASEPELQVGCVLLPQAGPVLTVSLSWLDLLLPLLPECWLCLSLPPSGLQLWRGRVPHS